MVRRRTRRRSASYGGQATDKQMIWFFYNILFLIIYVLIMPHFLLRMWKRGGYRKGFFQRVGLYGASLKADLQSRRRVWIHAVSVGEIFVALRFMKELRACRPETAFVLTTTTSTAHAIAEKKMGPDDVLLYFPADVPLVVKRVLDCLKPLALLLIECEIWPNLIRIAGKRNIPVVLLNGRISDRSCRGYKMLRPLVKTVLDCFNLLCAQGQDDAKSLIEMGAYPERIRIMGSAKYDITDIASEETEKAGEILRKNIFDSNARLLVGGSTWPGEETALLDIYKSLLRISNDSRLVLVPRHAERADEVAKEIEKSGLSFIRRSAWDGSQTLRSRSFNVLLVDTTGELNTFYSMANVIFVGKSLTNHGGQNVIEPAVFAKPIIVGPHTKNFSSVIADFLAADALIQVQDRRTLEETIIMLWDDSEKRQAYGQRARQLVRDKAGSVAASVKLILPLIES